MPGLSAAVLLAAGLLFLLSLLGFALLSRREGEVRAFRVSLVLAPASALPFLLLALAPDPLPAAGASLLGALLLAGLVLWIVPVGRTVEPGGRPTRRVDERDIMFARVRLRPGTPEYAAYYALRPENRPVDDRIRSLPGLLSPRARLAEPLAFAAAEAGFAVTEALRDEVDGPVAATRRGRSPAEWRERLEGLARHWGALDVGVCELRPYHVYTHVGRGTGAYGEEVVLEHDCALAFTVEMDHGVMASAPEAPVVAESARQYVESARIAVQLASLIRDAGYPARAHIDGNYRVIAPLVARDAGLGEIGRMGLLMTPRLGPRVRLGVVTTTLPLDPDPPGDDLSMLDFCLVCSKCAENCPPGAIPEGDRLREDGALRWRIDSESCFRYWNVVGTDCGKCMSVCPYSHPDNAAHNLVRRATRRSGVARRLLLRLDDLFYGRKPPSRPSSLMPRESLG